MASYTRGQIWGGGVGLNHPSAVAEQINSAEQIFPGSSYIQIYFYWLLAVYTNQGFFSAAKAWVI